MWYIKLIYLILVIGLAVFVYYILILWHDCAISLCAGSSGYFEMLSVMGEADYSSFFKLSAQHPVQYRNLFRFLL